MCRFAQFSTFSFCFRHSINARWRRWNCNEIFWVARITCGNSGKTLFHYFKINIDNGFIHLSFNMLKNGQTYFKNLAVFAVFTGQDFWNIFCHFSTLWIKWLKLTLQKQQWYLPIAHQYSISIPPETITFLTFSGVVEMEYWPDIG